MSWMMRNANALVHTVSAESLQKDETMVSSKLGFETLCTYNWLNNGSAILVPGGPPRWSPKDLPVVLPRDTGYQFVDQNAFRVPRFPFEPAFQALSVMNENIQFDDTDLVVNRNSLRKLLDFAAGRRQDPFRMDLHMVKNTLFVSRRERKARMMIHGAANSGYGHNFETVFTEPQAGLNHSSSHHRVIRYKIGSLDCVVRFEVDACHEDGGIQHSTSDVAEDVEGILASLASLAIDQDKLESRTCRGTKVLFKGTTVTPTSLVELKAHKTVKVNKAMPQLWFGRTPYLITGKHVEGIVHSVSCDHVEQKFEAWENTNQETLQKLVSLLKELKQVVGAMEDRTAILMCQQKGAPLRIFSEKQKSIVLPSDITDRYWRLGMQGQAEMASDSSITAAA